MENNKKTTPDSALRLKKARETLKLTQVKFSQPLDFKNSYISEMEAGDRNISKNVLIKLANVYNLNPTWILLGTGNMFLNEKHIDLQNQEINLDQLEPALKKLNWYCLNSPFVKHSVLGFFLRLLRKDKDIIEDDIKINQSCKQDSSPVTNKNRNTDKEGFNHGTKKNKAQGHPQTGNIKKTT